MKIILIAFTLIMLSLTLDITAGPTFSNNIFGTEVANAGAIWGDPNSDRIYDAPKTIYDSNGRAVYTIR